MTSYDTIQSTTTTNQNSIKFLHRKSYHIFYKKKGNMFLVVLLLIVIASLTLFYYKFVFHPKRMMRKCAKAFRDKGFKVCELPFMFLGSFMTLRKQNIEKYGDCYYQQKRVNPQYDLVIYNMLCYAELDLVNPQLQKAFLSLQNMHNYGKISMSNYNIKRTIGSGIILSEGDEWKYRRRLMNIYFSYDFLASKIPIISQLFTQGFEEMENNIKTEKEQKVFSAQIYDALSETAGNVIMECFLGISAFHERVNGKSLASYISSVNAKISHQQFSASGLLLGAKFLDLGLRACDREINEELKFYKSIVRDKILTMLNQEQQKKDRNEPSNSSNIVSILFRDGKIDLNSKYCLKETDGSKYGLEQILDEFSIFYLAGIQATSHFLLMMIYYIANDARIERKLREEIDKVIKKEEDITVDNLKKLHYIDWIEYEVTRHYGPVNGIFDREAIKDHHLLGVPIYKGTLVTVQPLGTHYDPKYFKEPFEFRPERWESECKNLPPYVLTGFSGGPRSCIGKHLAYLEAKIGLVVFMLRYESLKLPKNNFILQYGSLPIPEPMKLALTKK